METIRIDTYSIVDYSKAIQKAISEGYEFDFDTPAYRPKSILSRHSCVMVRRGAVIAALLKEKAPEPEPLVENTTELVEDVLESVVTAATKQPFTPSVAFVVEMPEKPVKKGRTRKETI